MTYVNENIRILRNRMGLTQEKFAELIGINRKAIGAYEEKRATPPLDKLNRMASLFGVSLDQLTQYRFAADSPLFEAPEEIPVQEEPFPKSRMTADTPPVQPEPGPQTEKKRPFSRTGYAAEPVLEPVQEDTVPYVSHKYFDKYLVDTGFESRLGELPALSFPFREEGKMYRAFDMPADSYLQDGIIIGEKLSGLPDGAGRLLVVSLKNGLLLRRLENTPQGDFIVKNEGGEDFILRPSDVREIWKPVGFFSRTLPAAQPDLAGLSAKVNALKSQLDSLL
ncbi:MAG: helix-turn-helix transcriptional regulator [Leadbetterella sp.]|nr:helix-turn-helix transcriptional regulator [Leadbetterella sp.]